MLTINEDKLRLLLVDRKDKIEQPKYRGIGEIISGISIVITLSLADFSLVTIIKPLYFQVVAWILALGILLWGISSFIKSIVTFYSVDNLYNEIADLDPDTEHPFNIILIKNGNKTGKYLLFKSKRWNCWLFPNYSCLQGVYDVGAETNYIRDCLQRDTGMSKDSNIQIEYLGNKISHKYSVSDKITKKYNFHYFQIEDIKLFADKERRFSFNGKKYCWKTLDQMYSNRNIVKKNQDVLDYVRTTCNIS